MKKLLLIASLLSAGCAFGMQMPEDLQKKMNTYTEEKAQLDLKYKETLKAHTEFLQVSRDCAYEKELQDRKERIARANRKMLKCTGAVVLVGAGIGYGIGYAVGGPNPAQVRKAGMILGALAGVIPGGLIGILSSMEGTNCI